MSEGTRRQIASACRALGITKKQFRKWQRLLRRDGKGGTRYLKRIRAK